MTDQELRDKLASERRESYGRPDGSLAEHEFKVGWDAARANGHSAYQPMYPELSEQIDQLRIELADEREALNVLRSANRLNIEERDQLRAEVERYRLAERLPPRPKCPDCGVESLTGNVHDEHCFNWSNLVEERDAARAEVERFKQTLEAKNMALSCDECRRERDNLKQALAVAKEGLRRSLGYMNSLAFYTGEMAQSYLSQKSVDIDQALTEIEKLEGKT